VNGIMNATSDSGPFYCPRSKKYIWITPFEELKTRFGAQGRILQPLTLCSRDRTSCANFNGNLIKMRQLQQGKSKAEANKLSVALELQSRFMPGLDALQKNECYRRW
jgi:predicted metalloprotease